MERFFSPAACTLPLEADGMIQTRKLVLMNNLSFMECIDCVDASSGVSRLCRRFYCTFW